MAMEESCKEESATTVCWVNYKLLEVMSLKDLNGNSDLQSTTPSYGQCRQIRSIQLINIPRVAAQTVRWPSIPKVSCPLPRRCSRSCDLQQALPPCNTWSSGGTALCIVGSNGLSIGSIVSDAIVRSWLCSAATGRSPLGYFSSITASS